MFAKKAKNPAYDAETQSFMKWLKENDRALDEFSGLMAVRRLSERLNWRGYFATPAGSPLETVVNAFRTHTNLPLDLAYHTFLFYLSAHLLQRGTTFNLAGMKMTPEIWTVILAPSGSGKTFSAKRIGSSAPTQATFPECASGARFIEAMEQNEEAGNANIWLQDEFGQKLKAIETEGHPLADAREYLLRAYDGDRIERSTKRETITVTNSRMCILAMNVDKTFKDILSPESLLDGFAQRFAYVIAVKDGERPFYNYALYDVAAIDEEVGKAWKEILATTIHDEYEVSPEAVEYFTRQFRDIGLMSEESGKSLPESFFRRLMFRATRLALLFHLIGRKNSNVIDADDMSWAVRLTVLHIEDAANLIVEKSPNVQRYLDKAQEIENRKGRPLTKRDLQTSGVPGLQNGEAAATVFELYKKVKSTQ